MSKWFLVVLFLFMAFCLFGEPQNIVLITQFDDNVYQGLNRYKINKLIKFRLVLLGARENWMVLNNYNDRFDYLKYPKVVTASKVSQYLSLQRDFDVTYVIYYYFTDDHRLRILVYNIKNRSIVYKKDAILNYDFDQKGAGIILPDI